MDTGQALFSFRGRLSRKIYWLNLASSLVLLFLMRMLQMAAGLNPVTGLFALAVLVFGFWVLLAAQVRRFRDLNLSGLWVLALWLVPLGISVAAVLRETPQVAFLSIIAFYGAMLGLGIPRGTANGTV